MSIWERIGTLLRSGDSVPIKSGTPGLRDTIETARRAKLAEDYPRALEALDRGLELVKDAPDGSGAVVIFLQKADVYIRQGDYAQAAQSLDAARAKADGQQVQIAYVTIARGSLALAQDQLDEAHSFYEQALRIAQDINAPGAEGRAQGLRGQLFLREGNASYAAHLLREALPKLNLAADIELSPLFVGLLGEASIQMGQVADGVHLLERALRLAEQMGDRVSERRWALTLGERAEKEVRLLEARAYFQRAIQLLGDKVTTDRVMALCKLSGVCVLLRQYDDALHAAEEAYTLSAECDAQTTAIARGTLGKTLRSIGRNADAIPHLRAASEAIEGAERIEVLNALSSALADTGEMEAAVAVCEQALEHAEQCDRPLEKAQARRNLGLLHYRAGRMQEAVSIWTGALALFEEENASAQIARLLCDLGNARKTLGLHQRAQRDYEQALTVLNSVDSGDIETRGLVLSNAANAYAEQGDADSADAFFNESIALAEKLGDAVAETTRRNNYGYFLVQIGRPRRAITMLEQALTISRAQGLAMSVAVQLDNLGLAHDASGEYSVALDYHEKALTQIEKLDQPYWRASIQINLAQTQIMLGEFDTAAVLLDSALDFARVGEHIDLIARALIGQALIAVRMDRLHDATGLLDESINLARRADLRRWLAEALSVRSEKEAALGDFESARASWEDAARHYNMLRMPQGKRTPAWLHQGEKA